MPFNIRAVLLGMTMFVILWVPAFMAPKGDTATYLPLIQRSFPPFASPDGNLLLYTVGDSVSSNIFVSPPPPLTDTFQITSLSATEHVSDLQYSPDGNYILHLVTSGVSESFYSVVGTYGQPNITLAPPPIPYTNWHMPEWGPDSNTLFYLATPNGSELNNLYSVALTHSEPLTLATNVLASVIWDNTQVRLFYVEQTLEDDTYLYSLIRINADGSDRRVLLQRPNFIEPYAVLPDGRLLFLNEEVPANLFLMDPDGTNVTSLNARANDFFALSPDGTLITYLFKDALTLMDTTGKHILGEPIRCPYTRECRVITSEWSPDGREIAFVIDDYLRGFRIHTLATDGSQQESTEIISMSCYGQDISIEYSPDGQYLGFSVCTYEGDYYSRIIDRATQTTYDLYAPTGKSFTFFGWRPNP